MRIIKCDTTKIKRSQEIWRHAQQFNSRKGGGERVSVICFQCPWRAQITCASAEAACAWGLRDHFRARKGWFPRLKINLKKTKWNYCSPNNESENTSNLLVLLKLTQYAIIVENFLYGHVHIFYIELNCDFAHNEISFFLSRRISAIFLLSPSAHIGVNIIWREIGYYQINFNVIQG